MILSPLIFIPPALTSHARFSHANFEIHAFYSLLPEKSHLLESE